MLCDWGFGYVEWPVVRVSSLYLGIFLAATLDERLRGQIEVMENIAKHRALAVKEEEEKISKKH